MNRVGVPELILSVEPLMRELLDLREENLRLRFKTAPPMPDLETLTKGTAIELKQTSDGRWSSSIRLSQDYVTGVGGVDDPITAFRRALEHIQTVWQQRESEWEGEP